MLQLWSVIDCNFVHWTTKLTLVTPNLVTHRNSMTILQFINVKLPDQNFEMSFLVCCILLSNVVKLSTGRCGRPCSSANLSSHQHFCCHLSCLYFFCCNTVRPWDGRFLGDWKKMCSSKFMQLELLNKAKVRTSKKCIAEGFYYINWFTSNFLGPFSKKCIDKVRAAWGRVSWGCVS